MWLKLPGDANLLKIFGVNRDWTAVAAMHPLLGAIYAMGGGGLSMQKTRINRCTAMHHIDIVAKCHGKICEKNG